MAEVERMMHSIPDDNTMEIAEYGSKYMDVKSSLYISDLMIDFLNREAKQEYDQLDLDIAEFILIHRPYWLTQEIPHADTIEQMTVVRRLKIILQDLSAIDEIELTKAETKQYGMMCSTEDYGKHIVERGLDTELFRAMSIENADSPLDFESIRRIRDHDSEKRTAEEEFEYRQYLRYIREMEELENERIRQARERDVELVDVPEPEISDDILEDQYADPSDEESDEECSEDAGEYPDDGPDIMGPDCDIDVFEADSAFLENLIMCTVDLVSEETVDNLTGNIDEETEPLLGTEGLEHDTDDVEEMPVGTEDEIAEFLEEYCDDIPRPRFGRLFGRFGHGH